MGLPVVWGRDTMNRLLVQINLSSVSPKLPEQVVDPNMPKPSYWIERLQQDDTKTLTRRLTVCDDKLRRMLNDIKGNLSIQVCRSSVVPRWCFRSGCHNLCVSHRRKIPWQRLKLLLVGWFAAMKRTRRSLLSGWRF